MSPTSPPTQAGFQAEARPSPLADDRARMLSALGQTLEPLRDQTVFLTGGTGFVGCWLLEALLAAIDAQALGTRVHVLSRDPSGFSRRRPHLASHPAVALHAGDVRSFAAPGIRPDFVIHGATDASARLNAEAPLTMLDTIVEGTRRTLDFARDAGARRLLLISSGAVYGPQPPACSHLEEGFLGGPSPLDSLATYAEGKRLAELTSVLYQKTCGLEVVVGRLFAFIGPYLPIDRHLAAGNFIRDALHGGPIRIEGDGTPLRSYMYGADMAVWLWTLLLAGQAGQAYNVGSERALSIAELAAAVAAEVTPAVPVEIAAAPIPGRLPARYVPATGKAREALGLRETVGLDTAISRTLAWHRTGTRDE